ncbi:predicted protein [Naegleria gruberi]|uniref:Predicted protein n=1 Tax=Naegleria gruberi TaxID=5762 RepID=D2VL40_NAEGR|nr:uncharacterized protein NAEGRDRAFT_80406 [Naegleria gruberi]EFC42472.1 predicted protein [Naegleria gruberi]|eukprot:XP_002675216.1 predicted protein [Naegleria gruberi strain NEG-M]
MNRNDKLIPGYPVKSATITIDNKNVLISDLSETPGGTIYGTTPGGTRRIYTRNALLLYRNSPMAKSPPINLPTIPGITTDEDQSSLYTKKKKEVEQKEESDEEILSDDEDQFQMD